MLNAIEAYALAKKSDNGVLMELSTKYLLGIIDLVFKQDENVDTQEDYDYE